MKYTQKTFTVPVGSNRVTQEKWDQAFPERECAMVQPQRRTAVQERPQPKKAK